MAINFTGLLAGVSYRFKVQIVSDAGTSPESEISAFFSSAQADPLPADSVVVKSSSFLQITLQWTVPVGYDTGGGPIYRWDVYVTPDRVLGYNPEYPTISTRDSLQTEVTFDCPESSGEYYWFKVAAITNAETGHFSPGRRFRCAPRPEAPAAPGKVKSNQTSVTLSYDRKNMYSAVHFGYNIYVDDGIQGAFYKIAVTDTSMIEYTVGNLEVALPYRFKVSVVSEVGESDHSPIATYYPGDIPIAPLPPTYVNSTLNSITVQWSGGDPAALSQSGGNDYLKWLFQASYFKNLTVLDDQVGIDWTTGLSVDVPFLVTASVYEYTVDCDNVTSDGVTSLVNEFVYFRAAAITNVGQSDWSPESRIRCTKAPEAPSIYEPTVTNPGNTIVSSSSGSVVSWYENDVFGATLLGFEVHANDGLGSDVELIQTILDSSSRTFRYVPPLGTTIGYLTSDPTVIYANMMLTTETSTTTKIENRPFKFKVAVITDVTTGALSDEITIWSCAPPVLDGKNSDGTNNPNLQPVVPYVAAGVFNLTGNGLYSLTLGWNPPSDTGGCTIVGYRIEKDNAFERLPDSSVVDHGSDSNFTRLDPLLADASSNFTLVYPTEPGPDPDLVAPYVSYADGNETLYANYTQYGNLDSTVFTATYVDAGITKGYIYLQLNKMHC
eukprot:g1275.t1